MMELALIKTMMNKEFYERHKGIRCPDKIFTKDTRKIKQSLDVAMKEYDTDLSASDLEALFFSTNQTMTTSNKEMYKILFSKLTKEQPMNDSIAEEVLSKLFQQVVGEEVANLGFDYVNGTTNSLEPLRNILEKYQDDFTPNLKIEYGDISFETILKSSKIQSQWKFNIPSLKRKVEGISGGHFIIVGARPNTGKTSFHASSIAAPNGFAHQGAKCMVLCNEEDYIRVAARYLCAASSMSLEEINTNQSLAMSRYSKVRKNITIIDSTSKDLAWVESIIKQDEPDIVIIDIGDKFAPKTSDKSDVYLKDAAIYARNIAKQYNCAVIWMSQLNAEAEGRVRVDQSMLEGSRTGKAAEADLILLVARNPITDESEEEDRQRHLVIAKNKLTGGWHGTIHCNLDGERSQYLV
jgi:KaiC/GvpD/RAD55 family RecA-like ATPase